MDSNLKNNSVWTPLAAAHTALGEDDRATEIIDRVINDYKDSTGSDKNKMLWSYSGFNSQRGFNPFELRTTLSKPLVLVMLGEAYRAKGDYDLSRDAFQKAAQSLPDNPYLKTLVELMTPRAS